MIHKVELTNYRCYTSYTHEFTDGLNIIAGANGIGKTSIVEAVSFALFGNKLIRGKANSWLRHGTKHGKVCLYLDKYVITRGDNEQLVETIDGSIIAKQHVGVDEWIQETYGLTAELYTTANYIAQKDIETFSSLQAADRVKRVEKLLRIDTLDIAKTRLKLRIKELNSIMNLYLNKIQNVPLDLKSLKKAKVSLKKSIKELEILDKVYKKALFEKGAFNEKAQQWTKKVELETKVKNITYKDPPYTITEIDKIIDKLKQNDNAEIELLNYKDIKAKDSTDKINNLREAYIATKAIAEQLKDITEICPTCKQQIPDATKLIKRYDNKVLEMQNYEKQGKEATKSLEKYKLKQYLYSSKFSSVNLEQMKKDIANHHYLKALEEYKDVTKPKEIKTSIIITKFDSLSSKIKQLEVTINDLSIGKAIHKEYDHLLINIKKDLQDISNLVKFIDKYRKEFSQNVIPLIEYNASTVFSYLTNQKFLEMIINKDYGIENYEEYSGSEADSASFALRMAIANISRLGSFNTIILDEVSASFDNQKEELLIELLQKTKNQLIYISHGDL